jgi:hypothetical protein
MIFFSNERNDSLNNAHNLHTSSQNVITSTAAKYDPYHPVITSVTSYAPLLPLLTLIVFAVIAIPLSRAACTGMYIAVYRPI